jgi:hypothetical protein
MSRAGRWPRGPLLLALALTGVAGCTGAAPEGPARAAGAPGAAPDTAPVWSREGLEAQPRMAEFRRRTAAAMAEFAPGTTAWRARGVPGGATALPAAASPGALLHAVALALGWPEALGEDAWEQSYRVWREGPDRALGTVLVWGLQDDSLVGQDLLVRMRRGAAGWVVEGVEERFHCGRGVTAEGLCV